MKVFTLPSRDLEIKFIGLLAVILIRTVRFKPVFLQDQAILLKDSNSSRHWYIGSISKDFTLPRRDLEIKLYKCGLLAVILIRTVLFKPVCLNDQGHIVKIGCYVNCRHCYEGSISVKDFTLPRTDLEVKLCNLDYWP